MNTLKSLFQGTNAFFVFLAAIVTVAFSIASYGPTARLLPCGLRVTMMCETPGPGRARAFPASDVTADRLLTQAREANNTGNYAAAISLCTEVLAIAALPPRQKSVAHDYLSYAYLRSGRYADSKGAAGLAMSEDGGNYMPRLNAIKARCALHEPAAEIAADVAKLRLWRQRQGFVTCFSERHLFKLCKYADIKPAC